MKQFNKTNLGWLILIAVMAVVLFVGVSTNMISPFYQITLVTILINIILAIGLNLVIGFSGQFSLGHGRLGRFLCRIGCGHDHLHHRGFDRRNTDAPSER